MEETGLKKLAWQRSPGDETREQREKGGREELVQAGQRGQPGRRLGTETGVQR